MGEELVERIGERRREYRTGRAGENERTLPPAMAREHVRGRRAESEARPHVVPLVAHDRRAARREPAGAERAFVEKRPRLAAAAFPAERGDRPFGVVRTNEDVRENDSPGGIAAHDLGVHGIHLLTLQKTASEAGLVRDDEERRSLPREDAQAPRRARREPNVARVSEETALDDERPVAVEEERVEKAAGQEPGASALRTPSPKDFSVCGPASRATRSPLRL